MLRFLRGGAYRNILIMKQFIHTFEEIINIDNLLSAWKEFVKGKRNKADVQEFQLHLMDHIISLHTDLRNKTYQHGSYTQFHISDPKPRLISKASVRDRLLHRAIYRILYPFFDNTFISNSYSCRINKGTHKALNQFRKYGYVVSKNNTKTCWVLKCDIKKFFDSIDHHILLSILKKNISDLDTLWLLENVIASFSSTKTGKGLPLGNLTSQLLVNIYMHEFDSYIKHNLHIKHYIRYADDFIILSDNRTRLTTLIPIIQTFLAKSLALQLHPKKVFISTLASGVDFLGWVHFPDRRVLRTSTKKRMLKRITNHPTSETLASYRGLLRHGNTYKLIRNIEKLELI